MKLRYLLEKEFKQFFRHPFLSRMALFFPLMIMLVMPHAANFEVKEIRAVIIDNDHTPLSRQLAAKVFSSGYFLNRGTAGTYEDALRLVDAGKADMIIDIPQGFERSLVNNEDVALYIGVDTVNGSKGGMANSYITSIINDFSANLLLQHMPQVLANRTPNITVLPRYLYNTHLRYTTFMVPALMVMILLMLCGFLPALNIVTEKENGTIEQMNVSPVNRFSFIAAKLIPYWIIGIVALSIGFVVAWFMYGLFPVGSLLLLYGFSFLFIFAISGFGLVVSNYAASMQQAMFMMYFFIMLWIYVSGLFTPVRSMPHWAQMIAVFSPFTYIIEVYRSIYLKGSVAFELETEFKALCAFSLFFYTWAMLSYKKRS